jgi:2-haloacid dehalogenase
VNTSPGWRKSALVASRFAGWTCCTGTISNASFRASACAICPKEVLNELTLAWHRLDAWPDVPAALKRLRKTFLLAPVFERQHFFDGRPCPRNEFPGTQFSGAEIAGDYKPKPRVYLAACEALNLKPRQCMMVAAHSNDLAAAAACGLRTGHTARPNQYGPDTGERSPAVKVDVVAKDLADLAEKLGV